MADRAFVDYCLELFRNVGPVSARRMFGGHGFYAGDVFFALVAADSLYLKVDDLTRADFTAAGSEPFVYDSKRRQQPVTMSYWSAPLDAMDDPAAMTPWAERAIAAARRAQAAKSPKRKRAAANLP
jgi:DNA transformation protein and related proteins